MARCENQGIPVFHFANAQVSPNVVSLKVVRTGKVRRSKLYYLRDRGGKAARVKSAIS